jgi:predicted nucleotidyltransferase
VRSIRGLSEAEQSAINEFRERIVGKLGNNLHLLRLFGSKARGDSHQESDIDMFIVVGHKSEKAQDAITSAGIDMLLEYQLPVTTIMRSIEEFNYFAELKTNFFLNVMEEGIDLWISPEMKTRLEDL